MLERRSHGSGHGRNAIEREPEKPIQPDTNRGFEPLGLEELEDRAAAVHGDTPVGREAAKTVRALVKAARSIVLYEAGNQAVAGFLTEFQQRITDYLGRHGALDLVLSPYEITSRGETVYAERDLERSLAVRLYTDGVRRLTIATSASWQELTRLVGILAVRFKGIRQQEDDVVTLLWKAELEHIQVEAVAGFVAADPDDARTRSSADGSVAPRNELQAAIFEAPYTFPYPAPEPAEPVQPRFQHISAETLAGLAAEDGDTALSKQCLALAGQLLSAANDPALALPTETLSAFLRELRDGLLAADHTGELVLLAVAVARDRFTEAAVKEALLAACLDRQTLEAVLSGSGPAIPPATLRELAEVLAGEQVGWLLESVAAAQQPLREELRGFLIRALAARSHLIRPWATRAKPAGAVVLLQLLTELNAEEGTALALEMLGRNEAVVQRAALTILAAAPYSPKTGRALVTALEAGEEEVRLGALQLLVRNREGRAVQAIQQRIERLPADDFSPREAGNLGAALALLAPTDALKVFSGWVRPGGLLQRMVSRPPALLWAAGGGLAKLGGAESEELLERLAGHGPEELQQRCRAVLERRRSSGGAG